MICATPASRCSSWGRRRPWVSEMTPILSTAPASIVRSRVGDRLISTRFPGTETRGFAAVGEPGVAVCLLPGTELVFEREIETVHAFARLLPSFRFGMQGERLARFRRIDAGQPHMHHDALE